MTLATDARAFALSLVGRVGARDVALVLTMMHEALGDNVDPRITNTLLDAAYDLEQVADEIEDETCTCPMSPVYPTSIDPPERMIGKNRDCPVHGIDSDAAREAQREDKWDR